MHEEGWPPWVAERPLESETSTMANKEKKLVSLVMARRPGSEKPDVLSDGEVKQFRHTLAHLSPAETNLQ